MNAYHRRYCRSAKWGHTLQSSVLPWALRDFDLGGEVLERRAFTMWPFAKVRAHSASGGRSKAW